MTTPRSNMLIRVMEEALDRPLGVEIPMTDLKAANKVRWVLYKLRHKLRTKTPKHPRLEEFELLDFVILKEDGNNPVRLVVRTAQLRFSDLKVKDCATGENISNGFEVIDEMVKLEE